MPRGLGFRVKGFRVQLEGLGVRVMTFGLWADVDQV